MHERRGCFTYFLLGFIWLYIFFYVTCTFQSESTLYSCLNFKELFARNRRGIYLLQSLGLIFDDIFGPKKKYPFCPVFVFHRGMPIGILKYILYFKNKGLNISWISRYNSILGLKNGFHNTVFYSVSIWT